MVTLSQTDIQNRRTEVESQLAKARAAVSDLETELTDLDATERTFSRMGGAARVAPRPADRPPAANVGKAAKKPKTTTAMIFAVMHEMGRGMEPREIADAIDSKGWGPINRNAVRTRIWHMAKDGKLTKDDTVYSLPENEKPAGTVPEGEEPAGLFPQAQGGEARPGGGT